MDQEKSTTNTEDAHPTHYCGMTPRSIYGSTEECGNPATLGWAKERGGLVPICEECIAWTKTDRKYLEALS